MSNDSLRPKTNEGEHVLQRGRAVRTLSFDTMFDLLAADLRRYALYALVGADDGFAEVEALADDVAMWEARADDVTITESRRTEIADELRHKHLPRMADADLVDYDSRSDVVRYWRQPTLEEYLEHTHFKEFAGE
ncbi:DUF7344 domain-containing protein [Halorussus amylolyticus]|uniref:DUF7344 domain-containing protein n=1 Tax=Halorussus amylolyticus TaxID=1126242 RepID=UPI00192F65BF|nr:hypothetical protein [Halorussus amylolyticus]